MDVNHIRPHSTPLFLSPVLPSDLLQFIINRCRYPTTLIICGNRGEFLSALIHDILSQEQQRQWQQKQQQQEEEEGEDGKQRYDYVAQTTGEPHRATEHQATTAGAADPNPSLPIESPHAVAQPTTDRPATSQSSTCASSAITTTGPGRPPPLLAPHLAQLSTARHIRTVFVPTVAHLRVFLSLFAVDSSLTTTGKAPPVAPPPPPPPSSPSPAARRALLVVYNLLGIHRHTSEWSVQGLGTSCAALVDAGIREGLAVVVAERPEGFEKGAGEADREDEDEEVDRGNAEPREGIPSGRHHVLRESVPMLGGRGKTVGIELGRGGGWAGKTVDVAKVLGRWFEFRTGEWMTRA